MRLHKLIALEMVRGLGLPGLAGALLLVATVVYALLAVLPAQQETVAAQQHAARAATLLAQVRSGAIKGPQTPEQRAQAFYAALPVQSDVTRWIEQIYSAAAAEKLSLVQGEYSHADVPGTRLTRYRIVLPVRGTYAQVRRFVAASIASVPSLSLDDLSLQRQNVGEPDVDALVHLSMYLVKRS